MLLSLFQILVGLCSELLINIKCVISVEPYFWSVAEAKVLSKFPSEERNRFREPFLEFSLHHSVFILIKKIEVLARRSLIQLLSELLDINLAVLCESFLH